MFYLISGSKVSAILTSFPLGIPAGWKTNRQVQVEGFAESAWRAPAVLRIARADGLTWKLSVGTSFIRQVGDENQISVTGRMLAPPKSSSSSLEAIQEWARACQQNVLMLDSSHYEPDELTDLIRQIQANGCRPVVDLGALGRVEISFTGDGKMRNQAFKGLGEE